ncbi:MAG: DUF5011 domain-containing protein [Akkermansiaceae bacterium]|nr:DUF5011 domain-containing protein [Akkermansiaceae bacterium]
MLLVAGVLIFTISRSISVKEGAESPIGGKTDDRLEGDDPVALVDDLSPASPVAEREAVAESQSAVTEVIPEPQPPAETMAKNEQAGEEVPPGLVAALSEARRRITPISSQQGELPENEGARFFAANPGEDLTARFLDGGVRGQSGKIDRDWQVEFRYLNDGEGRTTASPELSEGIRIDYQHGEGVTEWYLNRSDGFEHGFVLEKPQSDASGEERLRVAVDGDLRVEEAPESPGDLVLADESGTPVLGYRSLKVWDATGTELVASMRPAQGGREIEFRIATVGAAYPLVVDPLLVSFEDKLEATLEPGGDPSDFLGYSVSVSGDTAVVGAYADDTSTGNDAGSAYVFVRNGGVWSEEQKLEASDGAVGDFFGNSVSVSGDTAVVGAYLDDTSGGGNAGSAYIFIRSGEEWSEVQKLEASDGAAGDLFGNSVSVSGDIALVGAYADDTSGGVNTGSAYVYRIASSDQEPPVITLSGENPQFMECGSEYIEDGATVTDNEGISNPLVIDASVVNTSMPGSYVVTYTATDDAGNSATVTRTVKVVDTTPPAVVSSPANEVIECPAVPNFGTPVFTDACDPDLEVTAVDENLPVSGQEVSKTRRTWTATDDAGLSISTSQTITVQDTTPPVITLNGGNLILECGIDEYVETGAGVTDTCDESVAVVIGGDVVDVTQGHTYVVTYNATDASGNQAVQVTRTVKVVDTTPPAVVSSPADEVIECPTVPNFGTPVFNDVCDPDLEVTSADENLPVSGQEVSKTRRTWTATDDAGLSVSTSQTITVQDTTPPVITLNGGDVILECGVDQYLEAGAGVTDACDPNVSVVIGGDTVDPHTTGTYLVTYNATDISDNAAVQVTRTITVQDTLPPVITLTGSAALTLECGVDAYTEAGAIATDACDPNVSVVIGGDSVDSHSPGTYLVTYNATDISNNAAVQVTRTITVQDTLPPVITLTGSATLTLECGVDVYTELGAVATDACDPNVSVVIGGDTVDAHTPGTYLVTYNATDISNNAAVQVTRTITVQDTLPPVITLNGNASMMLCVGEAYTDPGASASDLCAGVLTDEIAVTGAVNTSASGTYVLRYNVSDPSGNAAPEVTRTVVVNAPPVVIHNGPYVVDEGDLMTLSGLATDEDDPVETLVYAWDLDGDGIYETPGAEVEFDAALLDGPATLTVALEVTDERGCGAAETTTIEVLNVAPTIESLVPTGTTDEPIALGTEATMAMSFSDPCLLDTHTVSFDWGDGNASSGVLGTDLVSATGSHTYGDPGVYRITCTVTDDDGDADLAIYEYVVVYDAEGGFVTGGGFIDSPAGAYAADPTLVGKANFGFVSKYKKGASIPTGSTEFNFNVAGFRFHSNEYDWLVVAGAKAMFKGIGSVNDEPGYRFLISAIDGAAGGTSDKFRIKIWHAESGANVYDNALGAAEDAEPSTLISGGNITVHSPKGSK